MDLATTTHTLTPGIPRSAMASRSCPNFDSTGCVPEFDCLAQIVGHGAPVTVVRFNCAANLLATGTADGTMRIWRVHVNFNCLAFIKAHDYGINDLAWSNDSEHIVTASDENALKLWHVSTRTCVSRLAGHTSSVFCCAIDLQGTHIASGSFDTTVRIWTTKHYAPNPLIRVLVFHSQPVTSVAFNRYGNFLATSGHDGNFRVWEVSSGKVITSVYGSDENLPHSRQDITTVNYIKFSPNGKFLLTSHMSGVRQEAVIKLWELAKSRVLKRYSGHIAKNFVVPVNFGHAGSKYIVTGSEDGALHFWNLQTGHLEKKMKVFDAPIIALENHPAQPIIAVSSNDLHNPCVKIYMIES